jgi:hypothetical protein
LKEEQEMKKIAILTIAGLMLSATSLQAELVGRWSFDECDATDSSGYGNDGTIYGATCVDGMFDQALSFDGVDDYVQVPDSPVLDMAGVFTVEGWVQLADLPTYPVHYAIVYKLARPNTNEDNYMLYVYNSKFGFRIERACDDADFGVFSTTNVQTMEWYGIM